MPFVLNRGLGCAVVGLALFLTSGAYANADIPGSAPPPWNDEKFERQDLREEMRQIRHEHDELDIARDKLLDDCVHAGAAKGEACDKEKLALHDWGDRLHERMRLLHDKIDAMHKQFDSDANGRTPFVSGK